MSNRNMNELYLALNFFTNKECAPGQKLGFQTPHKMPNEVRRAFNWLENAIRNGDAEALMPGESSLDNPGKGVFDIFVQARMVDPNAAPVAPAGISLSQGGQVVAEGSTAPAASTSDIPSIPVLPAS